MIFATIEFIYFLIKSTYERDYNIYDAMMGKITKYHFIPLFFASYFFGIGIYFNSRIIYIFDDKRTRKDILNDLFNFNIYGIILSILILASLIFIYIKMKFKNETFLKSLLIKKGTFSCLISLSVYTLFNNIFFCGMIKFETTNDLNIFNIFFVLTVRESNIMIWSFNAVLSMILKDIIISMMNFIISLGMFLELLLDTKLFSDYLVFFIINSILIVSSIVLLVILICKMKKKIK